MRRLNSLPALPMAPVATLATAATAAAPTEHDASPPYTLLMATELESLMYMVLVVSTAEHVPMATLDHVVTLAAVEHAASP